MTAPNTNAGSSVEAEPITLFEFLTFEFNFEMAAYIGCEMDGIANLRRNDPVRYNEAAKHVIRVVTPACQLYIMQKAMRQKMAREKLLATSTASQ